MSNQGFPPELVILAEDQANIDIANGFAQCLPLLRQRSLQVLGPARGWAKVIDIFAQQHIPKLRMPKYRQRRLILLMDFDTAQNRREYVQDRIPEDLKDRVFVLGCWDEVEALKKDLGYPGLEKIGADLATNCAENREDLWQHPQLQHNQAEVQRLGESVKPFLFGERG